ncbi:MAG: response regulator [Bacteroidales bacterium]|nr:response regulator [Bacteroidales bacterium]
MNRFLFLNSLQNPIDLEMEQLKASLGTFSCDIVFSPKDLLSATKTFRPTLIIVHSEAEKDLIDFTIHHFNDDPHLEKTPILFLSSDNEHLSLIDSFSSKSFFVSVLMMPFHQVELKSHLLNLMNLVDAEKIRFQTHLRETLLDVYKLSNIQPNNKLLAEQVWSLIKKLFPALSGVYCGIYNAVENFFDSVFSVGNQIGKRIPSSTIPFSLVLENKQLYHLSPENIRDLQVQGHTVLCNENCHWIGLPIASNNQFHGVISFSKTESQGDFTSQEKESLMLIVRSLSLIIGSRIATNQLNEALERSQQSERLKDNFLSNISHEIRTPLNAIIGFSSLLDEELAPEERHEYVEMIIDGGQNLMQIIDDIVDVARIQAGEIKIQAIDVNLIDLIHQVADLYYRRIENQQIPIKFKLELPQIIDKLIIKTDAFRLKQILENLLDNALKFTTHGEVTLGFRYLNNELLEFYVADTGIGIAAKDLNSIFNRFVQLEVGHVRQYGGNGLGLSITKSLVELMNGKISVESQQGIGSKFSFTLPLEQNKFVNGKLISQKYRWNDKRVLLVDDIEANLQFLEILMRKTGVKTQRAYNGLKALEAIARDPHFDLVIMDLQMPEMDGYTATRIIKSRFPHIKVIVQTAYSELSDRQKAFKSGCDDFMEKPIRAEELLKKIHLIFNPQ